MILKKIHFWVKKIIVKSIYLIIENFLRITNAILYISDSKFMNGVTNNNYIYVVSVLNSVFLLNNSIFSNIIANYNVIKLSSLI